MILVDFRRSEGGLGDRSGSQYGCESKNEYTKLHDCRVGHGSLSVMDRKGLMFVDIIIIYEGAQKDL